MIMFQEAVTQTNISGFPCRRGKVRDVYDLGDRLLLIATDRISAFDWVLPTPIPGKGCILTSMTDFWLTWLKVPNHRLDWNWKDLPQAFQDAKSQLDQRTMLVQKTHVFPVECVVRGYLAGSGWKEYQKSGTVCGIPLPKGLTECSMLPEAIFTPATKAESGHDENISFEQMESIVGVSVAHELKKRSLDIYQRAATYAKERGIIIADTKFEYGQLPDGEILLIDEVCTPDSSRFWPFDQYKPGQSQPSYDKQFVRDWLDSSGWDKNSTPPALPQDVVRKTQEKYLEALAHLIT